MAVLALAVAACGGEPDVLTLGSPDEISGEDLVEVCRALAEGERPDGMDQEAYEHLVASFRFLCEQVGVPLQPGAGSPAAGFPGNGAAGGAHPDADAARDADDQNGSTRTDGHLVGSDPFDDDVRRRAIDAGPQCDLSSVDLSMSEVAKAPAVGPVGSPQFDAELAKAQYRAPAACLPEPYRSEWLLIADAYDPVFDLLAAYAAASNQGIDALVGLGEQISAFESRLAQLQSDDVQDAIASTNAFFDELRATGAWDSYESVSPWGRWWNSAEFRAFWDESQKAGAWSGIQIPDVPAAQ